jgi:3-oxoacyl-[acyl-carrier protein] reductase
MKPLPDEPTLEQVAERWRSSDERRARLVVATHDCRAGTVEDIAETVFFLASPGARHLTGQALHVNGGAFTTR